MSEFFLPRVLLGDDAMNDIPDHELLRRYAEQGADVAFTELVRRHCDLVWAAARRVSGDADLARDVAQTVFTDLARKADKLPPGTVLAGWLYRAACHAAAKHIRGENRRMQRERQAMQQNELRSGDAEARAAAELQPVLDAALADLTEADRDAVVLRFLAGRSLAEVGATLGTNEDAAQKRVSRALEKLRDAFRKRGVTVSGGIVAAALGVAGTQAAPAGLAGVIATASLAGAGTAAWGTFSAVTFMKSKLALGIVGAAIVATTLAWQQRNVTRLADENAGLQRQVVAMRTTADTTMVPSTTDPAERSRLDQEHAELLRLRGEVGQLRRRNAGVSGAEPRSAPNKPEGPAATYAAIGAATPNAGLERLILASLSGDAKGVTKFASWRRGEGVPEELATQLREPFTRNLTNTFASNDGKVRILNQRAESDTLVRARVEWLDQTGKANLAELRFALEDGEWKPAFNIERSPSGSIDATFFLPPTPELGPTGQ